MASYWRAFSREVPETRDEALAIAWGMAECAERLRGAHSERGCEAEDDDQRDANWRLAREYELERDALCALLEMHPSYLGPLS